MGTRSITHIHSKERSSQVHATIYRQYDGGIYKHGMAHDIALFFENSEIVNGITGKTGKRQINGVGDMIPQLLHHLKEQDRKIRDAKNIQSGNIYLELAGSEDMGEEFKYHIYRDEDKIMIDIYAVDFDGTIIKREFRGTPAELLQKIGK